LDTNKSVELVDQDKLAVFLDGKASSHRVATTIPHFPEEQHTLAEFFGDIHL
jgi:hypothetical protein